MRRKHLEKAAQVFERSNKAEKHKDARLDEIYRQIGQLTVERDFLSRKLNL